MLKLFNSPTNNEINWKYLASFGLGFIKFETKGIENKNISQVPQLIIIKRLSWAILNYLVYFIYPSLIFSA